MSVVRHQIRCFAVKVDGVNPTFYLLPWGQQSDALRKVNAFKENSKSHHVGAKRRATMAAVKEWLRWKKPDQYYASWLADSSDYKDDSVQVWYVGGVELPTQGSN